MANPIGDYLKKMERDLSQGNMQTSSNTEASKPMFCHICGKEPICDGMGVIGYEVPMDDPRFGKMFRCPNNPPSADVGWHERLRRLSNLSVFADKSFSNFQIELGMHSEAEQKSLSLALEGSRRFAENPQGWLLLEGTYGSGKTHLAAAIGNARVENGDVVLFITVPDLLDHLRAAYSPSAESPYDEMFDRLREAPMLILDDLGTENATSWAQEKLFQLFNYRYVRHLPTVVTTNTDVDRLEPRIRSRLLDLSLVHRIPITASDFRNFIRNERDQLQSDLVRYSDMTFETFDTKSFVDREEKQNLDYVVRSASRYAENPEGWCVIAGIYGSGKTHLAAAIAHHRQAKGDTVMFITVPDLLDYLRTAYNPDAAVSFDRRFAAVRNVQMLILDDLGTENASPWAKEKLFQIIDHRYVTRLPTVITTGKELEKHDDRIRTRLMDDRRCEIIAITTASYAVRRRRRK